jgi:hypothetical protein
VAAVTFETISKMKFEVFRHPTELKSIIFWDVTPCSLLRCNRRFGGTYRIFCLPPAYLLVLLKFFFDPEDGGDMFLSETSVASQQTTRLHIPEDDTLHNHRCENLKSYIQQSYFYLIFTLLELV